MNNEQLAIILSSYLEKFKQQCPSKEKFYSSLTGKEISDKEYEHVLKVWNKFEMENDERLLQFVFKCDILLFTDVF